jgi:periplasmic copper chaperone A
MKNVRALWVASLLLLALPASADIVAVDGWVRAMVPGTRVGAGYVTLRNAGSESHKLLSLTSPVTDQVSLHLSSVDANGMSRMWPVGSFSLKPGEQVRFEPNGMHLMFMDMDAPFVVGAKVPVTFRFEGNETVTVNLEVKPLDYTPASQSSMDHAPMDRSKH